MNKFEPMITLDEAFDIMDSTLAGFELGAAAASPETVPVREAYGRRLVEDQLAQVDLPAFDKSAMDGYAVLADDVRDDYTVLETVPAGHVGSARLLPGTAVKVMTGAAVPEGTGKVIVVERTREADDTVSVTKHDNASNFCKKGEDVRTGDLILAAGTVLGSLEIANLISCGITDVKVAGRLRAAILSTGDEIVDSPDELGPGKIMNSNGPMLASLCAEHGFEVVYQRCIPDDQDQTNAILREALGCADVVMLSGGVSVGDFDFVLSGLANAGAQIRFSRIAVKPGKPTVFATAPGKLLFGLPGNPVSVYLMFHLFVLRAAARVSGGKFDLRWMRLRLADGYKRKKAERQSFIPGTLTQGGLVEPVSYHGSAHLSALMKSDGFFSIPIGTTELQAGEEVTFVPIPRGAQW